MIINPRGVLVKNLQTVKLRKLIEHAEYLIKPDYHTELGSSEGRRTRSVDVDDTLRLCYFSICEIQIFG